MSNIHSLPPEILILILRDCIRAIKILHDTSFPAVLMVCRHWRALAIQDPTCLSRIYVEFPDPSSTQFQNRGARMMEIGFRLDKWFSLARHHPIHLKFGCEDGLDQRFAAFWQSLATLHPRLPRFRTYWESTTTGVLSFLSSFPVETLQSLTHLRIDCIFVQPTEVKLPQLKVLCYQYLRKNNLLCPRLESLTISPTYLSTRRTHLNHILETLQQYPTVHSLSLDWVNVKPKNNAPESYSPFHRIHTLAIGSIFFGNMNNLLPYFPSTSTWIISDISKVKFDYPLSDSRIRELIILGHFWWRRSASPLRIIQVWDLMDCLHELECLRIGRELPEDDPYCQFDWPHITDKSKVRWEPTVVSAFVFALCSRKRGDESLRTLRCSRLTHIYLTCIHLDDCFLGYLMTCLKDRYESTDESVRKPLLTTKGCTSEIDISGTHAFPDVTALSYPEFKAIVDKLDAETPVFGSLFGAD